MLEPITRQERATHATRRAMHPRWRRSVNELATRGGHGRGEWRGIGAVNILYACPYVSALMFLLMFLPVLMFPVLMFFSYVCPFVFVMSAPSVMDGRRDFVS